MCRKTFLIKYIRMAPGPQRTERCEIAYASEADALTFCVVLRHMGGEVVELIQLNRGCEDAVLDGQDLDRAIPPARADRSQRGSALAMMRRRMGPPGSRYILFHFAWTIAIGAASFPIGGPLFHLTMLFNAAMAGAIAAYRGESLRARRVTLWDEAVALIAICALTGLGR